MNNPNVYRIPSVEPSKEHDHPFHLNKRGRRAVAVVALAASVSAGASAPVVAEHINNSIDIAQNPVEFSKENTTYTFDQGEGLDHATLNIDGIEEVDLYTVREHIMDDPANIEVFNDGVIQWGETVTIPESVNKR